jgi:hypothetical protein
VNLPSTDDVPSGFDCISERDSALSNSSPYSWPGTAIGVQCLKTISFHYVVILFHTITIYYINVSSISELPHETAHENISTF